MWLLSKSKITSKCKVKSINTLELVASVIRVPSSEFPAMFH